MTSLPGYTKKICLAFLAVISAAGLQQAAATNFIIEDQTLAGDAATVTVPVKVSDFANVGAMQFTISWDPAVLTYSSLGDFDHSTLSTELFFFGANNFNTDFVGAGNLAVLYEQILSADASIADDETIFSITFNVIGGDGSSTAVSFTDVPTPRKLASFAAANPD
ncbi:cohesin domain-containing protein, partial [Verrucomicrobia bacterium]|nr:cohesin domain-containing protein [Verrucomicrobiota bacterium]